MDSDDPLSFYKRKYKSMFKMMDVQNRNYITYEDITKGTIERAKQNCQNVSLLNGYSEFLPLLWDKFFENLAKEVDGEKRMTLEDYLTIDLDSEEGRKEAQWAADSFFDIADLNHDGYISPQEFDWYLSFWGNTNTEEREFAFKIIDADNDGRITREEFRNASAKYFCDHEDNDGKHFWGKFKT